MGKKDVAIIIPCRNEEGFIGKCLRSVIEQDFPKERMEVLVIDGMSEDRTREIVREFALQHSYIELHENPNKNIPSAMNIGITGSSANVIMKIDAHTVYERDYVSKCLAFMEKYGADNVGGLVVTIPRDRTLAGNAIACALSHVFGVGNARHRLQPEGPAWSDTAYSGCYRREIFDKVGLYDERIERSEDVAMNSKIRRAGGKILLVPEIRSYYYARSTFNEFIRHNFDNGYWITFPLAFRTRLFSFRHIAPVLFLLGLSGLISACSFMCTGGVNGPWLQMGLGLLAVVVGFYVMASLIASLHIALRERDRRYLLIMPVIFACLHFSYAMGSAWGLVRAGVLIRKKASTLAARS